MLQLFFENDHRERARTGRNITRTRRNGVCCRHSRSRVSFRWAEGDAGADFAARIEEFCAFFGERSGIFTGDENLREQVADFPGITAGLDEFVKSLDHVFPIIMRFLVNREHSGGIADTDDASSCQ